MRRYWEVSVVPALAIAATASPQTALSPHGRVFVSLESSSTKGTKPREPADFSLDSDSPAMQAQNPRDGEISWGFLSAQP